MVLDEEVGEGGREAGLDGEGPGARGAERGDQTAEAAGGAVLQQAGHRRPMPAGMDGGRRAGPRRGAWLLCRRLRGRTVWCSGLV